jgi:chaperonin GroES
MRVLGDRILLKRIAAKDTTEGGIIIPENARGPDAVECEVLEVGPGKYAEGSVRRPIGVNSGDRVLIQKYCGVAVDKDVLAVREDDILVVL